MIRRAAVKKMGQAPRGRIQRRPGGAPCSEPVPFFSAMIRGAIYCLCALASNAALAAEPPLARGVEGPPVAATLVGCDAQWNVAFDVAGQSRTIPAADLVTWGAFADPASPIVVELADGGVLAARDVSWSDDRLTLEGDSVARVSLPAEFVAAILFAPPREPRARQALVDRLRDPSAQGDRLVLDNDDELTGTFAGLAEGSRVVAASLVAGDKQAVATLWGGVELSCDASAIAALQPLGGPLVYLSDLTSQSYKHIPALQLSWPFQRDRNVLGGPLMVRSQRFLKGLGLHAAARLTYELDRPYRRLDAELAIDDAAAGRGSVEVRAFVDTGDGRWQNRFASAVVRGGDVPIAMSMDLSGAKRLSLLVDFADRGDERDYVDVLNARLVP